MLRSGSFLGFCFSQKLQREGTEAHIHAHAHALHHQRKWARAIYLRKMNQVVISHFCFLWITKRSQLFPGLPSLGRKDGGREGGRKSQALLQQGKSVLKQALLTSYFHFLETTCAIVGCHGYPPKALRRGKMRGNMPGRGITSPETCGVLWGVLPRTQGSFWSGHFQPPRWGL